MYMYVCLPVIVAFPVLYWRKSILYFCNHDSGLSDCGVIGFEKRKEKLFHSSHFLSSVGLFGICWQVRAFINSAPEPFGVESLVQCVAGLLIGTNHSFPVVMKYN